MTRAEVRALIERLERDYRDQFVDAGAVGFDGWGNNAKVGVEARFGEHGGPGWSPSVRHARGPAGSDSLDHSPRSTRLQTLSVSSGRRSRRTSSGCEPDIGRDCLDAASGADRRERSARRTDGRAVEARFGRPTGPMWGPSQRYARRTGVLGLFGPLVPFRSVEDAERDLRIEIEQYLAKLAAGHKPRMFGR